MKFKIIRNGKYALFLCFVFYFTMMVDIAESECKYDQTVVFLCLKIKKLKFKFDFEI